MTEKDLSLLQPEKYAAADDINLRIAKLKKEIAKGTAVYEPEELKKLENKLADYQSLLETLQKP